MSILRVSVKWNKQKFDNVPLNINEKPLAFKTHLQSLTNVPIDRQKIMVKGGVLKDDADWSALGIKDGHTFMMMGTAEAAHVVEATPLVEEEEKDKKEEDDNRLNVAGLENLGNTCYLNSTLQSLRAIPMLTDAIKKVTSTGTNYGPETTLTLGLKGLFNDMDNSSKVTPAIFVETFRTVFPQFAQRGPGGTYVQQDAEECWTEILMSLNKKLPNDTIPKIFGGELTSELQCKEAPDEDKQPRKEPFMKLSCHINEQTPHLILGLKKSLEETLTKTSPSLGREAVYTKISKISKLPLYLPIQFVRFFWKQKQTNDAGNKAVASKILKAVTYPMTLDVYDLCTSELQAKLQPKREALRLEEEAKSKKKQPDEKAPADVEMKPAEITENDSGLYELVAVITHKGRASDGGHYIAWVRGHVPELWLKYDDDVVTPVRPSDVLELDGSKSPDWHIAYMCLYASKGLL